MRPGTSGCFYAVHASLSSQPGSLERPFICPFSVRLLYPDLPSSLKTWEFRWDEDALLLQMRDGVTADDKEDLEVLFVGSLKVRCIALLAS